MYISVIICTFNPIENNLIRALDSILGQDLSEKEWEFLVVDNNSTIPVSTRKFIKDRGVRVVFEGRQGLSAARECGIKHASGDILVFVDDDNVLATDYLCEVKRIFETANIGIVSGTILPEYEKEPEYWFKEWEGMLAIRKPQDKRSYLTTIPIFNDYMPIGAGMAVRKKIIEDYYTSIANGSAYISGRVGTQLSSAEDIDLDFYAINQGFLVGTVTSLRLVHIIPANRTTINYICRLAVASTRSAAEVNKKWKNAFKLDVFSFFNYSRPKLIILFFVSCLLFFFPGYKIRYYFYKTLLNAT